MEILFINNSKHCEIWNTHYNRDLNKTISLEVKDNYFYLSIAKSIEKTSRELQVYLTKSLEKFCLLSSTKFTYSEEYGTNEIPCSFNDSLVILKSNHSKYFALLLHLFTRFIWAHLFTSELFCTKTYNDRCFVKTFLGTV